MLVMFYRLPPNSRRLVEGCRFPWSSSVRPVLMYASFDDVCVLLALDPRLLTWLLVSTPHFVAAPVAFVA